MDKINPEFNRETPNLGQEAGPEFYEQAQVRRWTTEAEKTEKSDKVAEIARVAPSEKKPDIHHEAGVPLKVQYTSEKEAVEAVDRLIKDGKDINPNDLHSQMENAWEQMNDKAA